MVAGKKRRFPVEQNSAEMAPGLVEAIWNIAAELKCTAFERTTSEVAVQDDHLALNRAGIPAIDIIDFDYPHWHRLTTCRRTARREPGAGGPGAERVDAAGEVAAPLERRINHGLHG